MENHEFDLDYIETVCMEIIGNAGAGRALVYDALDLALKEQYEAADSKLTEATDLLHKAHDAQFQKLMVYQLNGNEIPFQLIVLHALDMLMVASAERDMVKHIVAAKTGK